MLLVVKKTKQTNEYRKIITGIVARAIADYAPGLKLPNRRALANQIAGELIERTWLQRLDNGAEVIPMIVRNRKKRKLYGVSDYEKLRASNPIEHGGSDEGVYAA